MKFVGQLHASFEVQRRERCGVECGEAAPSAAWKAGSGSSRAARKKRLTQEQFSRTHTRAKTGQFWVLWGGGLGNHGSLLVRMDIGANLAGSEAEANQPATKCGWDWSDVAYELELVFIGSTECHDSDDPAQCVHVCCSLTTYVVPDAASLIRM